MKRLKKRIIENKVLIFYLTFFVMITHTLMNLPNIFEGGVMSDWIGFWGNLVGSFLGVLGAIIVVKYQIGEEKKKELKAKEPLLFPGIAKYENVALNSGSDLVPDGLYFHELNRFSEVSVPLINGGQSPVFDISYYFEIENIEELQKVYNKANTFSGMVPKAFFKKHTEENSKTNYPIEWYEFKYLYEYERDERKVLKWENERVLTYNEYVSVIMPGEKAELRIAKFITMIWSYYFIATPLFYTYEEESLLPRVKVNLKYKDYELKERNMSFYIEVGSHGTKNSKLRYTLMSNRIS